MTVYVINILLIFLYSLMLETSNIDKKSGRFRLFYFLAFLQSYLIYALKSPFCGRDMVNYTQYFQVVRLAKWDEIFRIERLTSSGDMFVYDVEKGFTVLCKLIGNITSDNQVFIAIVSLIILIPITVFLYKHSDYPLLSLGMFVAMDFFSAGMTAIRQFIAIAIICISYKYIMKRKFIPFLLLVALASTFHTSAWIFLTAYPASKLKVNVKHLYVVSALMAVIIIFGNRIISFVTKFFYKGYIQYSGFGLGIWHLMFFVFMIIAVVFGGYLAEEKKRLYGIALLGVAIRFFSLFVYTAFRLAYYFLICTTVIIPNVISSQPGKNKYVPHIMAMLFLFSLYVYVLSRGAADLVPYIPYWQ